MSGQPFERLIRLEDEELEANQDDEILDDKDTCKVAMMPNGSQADNLEGSFLSNKHKHQIRLGEQGKGLHFTLNGRHIRMNPNQLKYLSLITLTLQNAALNLTMRAARTQAEQFSTSVAVTVAEILKLLTCILLIWYDEISLKETIKSIKTHIVDNYVDTLKVAVPSFVYYIQNNLLYVGSTHLDAATGQVTYQLKILTTAIFSVLLLNKKLSRIQWAALIVLFVGVAMIETMKVSDHNVQGASTTKITTTSHSNETMPDQLKPSRVERPTLGILAIVIASCLSGFAGVYFEKILKNTSHVSLWIRNIQLSAVAIPIGLIQVILVEHEDLVSKGPFHGFTMLTWVCIILQVQGGLLVAVVVKFANNILKGFATSMAIVISTVASMVLFDFSLTPTFIFGASLVISSVMMYNKQ